MTFLTKITQKINKSFNNQIFYIIQNLIESIVIIVMNTMKPNSPPHRMIQLRRKTEKIVIPKATWDLSNKQNSNSNSGNFCQSSKSKNNSSKKSSAEKSIYMRKNMSMNQNVLKANFKKQVKNQTTVKLTKQKSLQKKHINKRHDKMDFSISLSSCFFDGMNSLLKRAKNNQNKKIKAQYQKCLGKYAPKTENEKLIFSTLSKHLQLWIDKYQKLSQKMKASSKQNLYDENLDMTKNLQHQYTNQVESQSYCSQPSICSYIVDPQQEVKMKPVRKQLRQQLQLNFSKVQLIRKKQMQ